VHVHGQWHVYTFPYSPSTWSTGPGDVAELADAADA
jgi:hypothetical protein